VGTAISRFEMCSCVSRCLHLLKSSNVQYKGRGSPEKPQLRDLTESPIPRHCKNRIYNQRRAGQMLASFPLPGLMPAILSTMLLPLMIPVVAMRNLRPVDQKHDQHSKHRYHIHYAPLFCLATHRMAAISVYVQPPRKKTAVVLACSLEEAKIL